VEIVTELLIATHALLGAVFLGELAAVTVVFVLMVTKPF
jgi:hypothetical protein